MLQKPWYKLMFRDTEKVCVGSRFTTRVSDQIEELCTSDAEFFSINPLRDTRRSSDVTAYRNILVEWDDGARSPEDQIRYVTDTLKLPFSLATFSGGKSVHFILSLDKDLPDEAHYRHYAKTLLYVLRTCDQKTHDPARLSRLPNGVRRDKNTIQTLYVQNEAVSLDELTAWLKERQHLWPKLRHEPRKRRTQDAKYGWVTVMGSKYQRMISDDTYVLREGRDNSMYELSCELLKSGYPLEAVEEITDRVGDRWNMPQHQIIKCRTNAQKYGVKK